MRRPARSPSPSPWRIAALAAVCLAATVGATWQGKAAEAVEVPPSSPISDQVIFSGLNIPTNIEFAPDGRIFVLEKAGRLWTYESITDTSRTLVLDISDEVHDYVDRGALGLAVHPQYRTVPWVYLSYSIDPGGPTDPDGVGSDNCGNDPSGEDIGCVVYGRLTRFEVDPLTGIAIDPYSPSPQPHRSELIAQDWCMQYLSHTVGDLAFGPDGYLYASGGEGAGYHTWDWGQLGGGAVGFNPCGDAPGGRGVRLAPPNSEGGVFRSLDAMTLSDPTALGGTIIRIDPMTGLAAPGNPLGGQPDPNAQRIIAMGLRNPFRFNFHPSTGDIWSSDIGWQTFEEINRIPVRTGPGSVPANMGWPCYEGPDSATIGYNPLPATFGLPSFSLCNTLTGYPQGDQRRAIPSYFQYSRQDPLRGPGFETDPRLFPRDPQGNVLPAGRNCDRYTTSTSGVAFADRRAFPEKYHEALFFADYAQDCIWVLPVGPDRNPSPARLEFVAAHGAVELETGPDGAIYYVAFNPADGSEGRIGRLQAGSTVAIATANPTSGPEPLTVTFDAGGSFDAPGRGLLYAWDLDGDTQYDEASGRTAVWTYESPGQVTVRLRVTDTNGVQAFTSVIISPGDGPPAVQLTIGGRQPWLVGDTLSFNVTASDVRDGPIPASSIVVDIGILHCVQSPTGETGCHRHFLHTLTGVTTGTFVAPAHEWPASIDVQVRAIDSSDLPGTASARLDPAVGTIRLESIPAGAALTVETESKAAPFDHTAIAGGRITVGAAPTTTVNGQSWNFAGWSDGGAASHPITVSAGINATLVARYLPPGGASPPPPSVPLAAARAWVVHENGSLTALPEGTNTAASPAPPRPIVSGTSGPAGERWTVTGAGEVTAWPGARRFGDLTGTPLNRPIVGMAATPSGQGYWLVANDGGIFSYGDAAFFGSTGAMVLNRPVVGMAAAAGGRGYWLVATDGGIFAFGTAPFHGSTGALILNQPIAGMVPTGTGGGYWLVANDGGVFSFGNAPFPGSAAGASTSKVVAFLPR